VVDINGMNTIVAFIGAATCGLIASLPVTSYADSAGPLNSRVTSYALALAGTPYRYGGISPETGFDCSGFVGHVIKITTGVNLPRSSHEMAAAGRSVRKDELRAGDIVLHNTQGRPNSHAGIYLGDGQFIHSPKAGEVVQRANLNNPYWRARFNGARRVIEESTQYAAVSGMDLQKPPAGKRSKPPTTPRTPNNRQPSG
jgi:NlpC/P60 family